MKIIENMKKRFRFTGQLGQQGNRNKKMVLAGLGVVLCLLVLVQTAVENTAKAAPDSTIGSPVLADLVTWDCVYFGSYPQSEVTVDTDPDTYRILQASKDWTMDGTITIDNARYKRIKKEDATSTATSYNWSGDDVYHYFKYEAIKWRVIQVDGTGAYMISDVALDTQKYNQEARSVTWKTSSLRSWLNGYEASANQAGMDYRSCGFLDMAFSSVEKDAILSRDGDKVRILSENELENVTGYGLSDRENRICKPSNYAQVMGAHQDTAEACSWWTSTGGNSDLTVKYVQPSGEVYGKGYSVAYAGHALRVAIAIDIKQTATYCYAGTVSSDGTVREVEATAAPTVMPTASGEETLATASPFMIPTPSMMPTDTPVGTVTGIPTGLPSASPTVASPDILPLPTATISATKTPAASRLPETVVPEKTPDAKPTPGTTPEVGKTPVPATAAPALPSIKKGSVWYHKASNGQYRVLTINKKANSSGIIGTVAYLCPIKKSKTSFTIPAKVTIEKCVFKVTTIAGGAFSGNKKIKQVVIGKNIVKINAKAFYGCSNLKKIRMDTKLLKKSSIGKNVFKKINKKAVVRVPKGKGKKYKKYIKAGGAAATVAVRSSS